MDRILFRVKDDIELQLLFITDAQRMLFFDGGSFGYIDAASLTDIDSYDELEYSRKKKCKGCLQALEIRGTTNGIYYVKLLNGDMLVIKYTIHGYGDFSQKLQIVKRKAFFSRYTDYEKHMLAEYELASEIIV